MDLKDMMSRIDTMNATTEQLVNSITITEGPVTNMSLAVQKQSRTPYSDATKVCDNNNCGSDSISITPCLGFMRHKFNVALRCRKNRKK